MKIQDILKIVFIHCIENKEREELIKKFASDFALENYEIHNTCYKPFLLELAGSNDGMRIASGKLKLLDYSKANNDCYGLIDCLVNHYSVIKTAYIQGFDNILVIEDDTVATASKSKFIEALKNIPEDYEMAQFVPWEPHDENRGMWIKYNELPTGFHLWGANLYLLNRNGMKFYTDFVDEFFGVADFPMMFSGQKRCKHYIYNGNIIIGQSNSVIHSLVNK